MQAKQAIVHLPHNILRLQEVRTEPLLPQPVKIGCEDRHRVWSEIIRLINSDKDVFKFEGFEVEVA